jgi:hypothetical protein
MPEAQITILANSISHTRARTTPMTSASGISGAVLLMTKMLSRTGGRISPLSMTIVIRTPNHASALHRGGG